VQSLRLAQHLSSDDHRWQLLARRLTSDDLLVDDVTSAVTLTNMEDVLIVDRETFEGNEENSLDCDRECVKETFDQLLRPGGNSEKRCSILAAAGPAAMLADVCKDVLTRLLHSIEDQEKAQEVLDLLATCSSGGSGAMVAAESLIELLSVEEL